MKEEQYSKLESEICVLLHPKVSFELWDELWLKYSSEIVPEIGTELEGEIDQMIDNG